uniref:Uncharacterized protein n=2 Tax=Monodelphis domestica TaxID=13616 RepID=A0A5F8GIT9_MONDO
MARVGGSDGEALAPRREMIEMNKELRRNRQEIVTGLNMFLEENEDDDACLEELEEEELDILQEEETETIGEDDSSKEVHNITRTPQKVSLRSISAMTDEERLMMRIKKFGIVSKDEFRKSPGASRFGFSMATGLQHENYLESMTTSEFLGKEVATDMEKKRKRLEPFGLL